jgi:hypothetical protein
MSREDQGKWYLTQRGWIHETVEVLCSLELQAREESRRGPVETYRAVALHPRTGEVVAWVAA